MRGWMELPGTSPYKSFWQGYVGRKKKEKVFIGLVPSVFL